MVPFENNVTGGGRGGYHKIVIKVTMGDRISAKKDVTTPKEHCKFLNYSNRYCAKKRLCSANLT